MTKSNKYYPERILDSKFENNKIYYLIKWYGYIEKDNTWEPLDNIIHCKELIQNYKDLISTSRKRSHYYCRVSSKKQSKYNEGHTSLQVQKEKSLQFIKDNNMTTGIYVEEVFSAKNMNKLKGLKYLCDISVKGDIILIYDISRFSRNIVDSLNLLEELNSKGVSVHSISDNLNYSNISTRNQFRIELCAANYLSEMVSQKVKASIEFRRARGDHIGNPLFGFATVLEEKTHIRTKVYNKTEMDIIDIISKNKEKKVEDILELLKSLKIKFRNKEPFISGIKRIINRLDTDLKNYTGNYKLCKVRKNKKNTPY
jgi:DNA invertase Pin-like site-specific DNA recombinase